MNHPTFDSDGYPTEETLKAISAWRSADGWPALFDLITEAWYYPERVWIQESTGLLCFSTGGWSGNESLIAALQDNSLAWLMTWEESHRGGLHKFRVGPREEGK